MPYELIDRADEMFQEGCPMDSETVEEIFNLEENSTNLLFSSMTDFLQFTYAKLPNPQTFANQFQLYLNMLN